VTLLIKSLGLEVNMISASGRSFYPGTTLQVKPKDVDVVTGSFTWTEA
jgi:hypothetical protein